MAKKAKKAMKESPRAKPSGNRGLVIGVVVAIVVIIALIFLLKGGREAAPTGPTGPAAPTGPTTEKKMVDLAPTPDFNSKCTSADKRTAVTLTYVPGTCVKSEGSLTFTMKNPSKTAEVEGVYFESSGSTGKKAYKLDNEVIAPGESKDYTVDLGSLSTELGETVTDLIVYPAQAGMACLNGRSIILKLQSCP